jgi:anti-anti-sigma factor
MNASASLSQQVRTLRTGTRFSITIQGRFDFGCHQAFRHAFEQVVPGDTVVVDLGLTEYLDSAALGMLLVLKDATGGKPIQIVGCKPAVKRILEIANFHQIFAIS